MESSKLYLPNYVIRCQHKGSGHQHYFYDECWNINMWGPFGEVQRVLRSSNPRPNSRNHVIDWLFTISDTPGIFDDFDLFKATKIELMRIRNSPTFMPGMREYNLKLNRCTFSLFDRCLGLAIEHNLTELRLHLFNKLETAPIKVITYIMDKLELIRRGEQAIYTFPTKNNYDQPIADGFVEILDDLPRSMVSKYLTHMAWIRPVQEELLRWYCDHEDYPDYAEPSIVRRERMAQIRPYVTNRGPFENRPWLRPRFMSEALERGFVRKTLETSKVSPVSHLVLEYVGLKRA